MIKLYALIYGNENFHSDFWTCIHDFLFFFANGLCLKIDLTSQIELLSCPCIHLPVISNIDENSFLINKTSISLEKITKVVDFRFIIKVYIKSNIL